MKHLKKCAQAALFAVGLVLFYFVIRSVEPSELQKILPALGGWAWLIFLYYPFMCAWDVWAWKIVLERHHVAPLPFKQLFWIRLAGEAVNNITPFLDIGGEPLKIHLLNHDFGVSRKAALKACLADRGLLLFSEIIFGIVGFALAIFCLPMTPEWKMGYTVTVVVLTLLSTIFTIFFYTESKRKLLTATLYHFIGWAAGGIEMYFLFRIMGAPITLAQGFTLEALIQIVRILSFFIPANLGAQEGGLALFSQLLGFNPTLGIVVSLLKRIRQLIWTAVGFSVWGAFQLRFKNPKMFKH